MLKNTTDKYNLLVIKNKQLTSRISFLTEKLEKQKEVNVVNSKEFEELLKVAQFYKDLIEAHITTNKSFENEYNIFWEIE